MGCGASRGAPFTATLAFIPRIQKERDDASLEPVQLKRLGIVAYDDFFTNFEAAVNNIISLSNKLQDALWDAKASLAFATSTDPESALDLEVITEGVRSVPQLLIDVFYADGITRPLPFEVQHVLTSRPAIAEADRAVAQAVEELTEALQLHPAPAQLSYDEGKLQLSVIPAGNGSAIPGAAQQYQRLHQHAVRASSALSAMRKAAPGLRFVVTVVPSPAPGARTFSWWLTPRTDEAHLSRTQGFEGPASSRGKVAATKRMATPLRVASAHGAAAIMDAAATVAQQAAAIAAAVTTTAAPLIQLELEAGRRLVAVTPQASFMAAAAAAAAVQRTTRHGSVLRNLPLTRGAESSDISGGGADAVSKCIAAADEAAAVLRRALTSANYALFRLAKRSTVGASSGKDAAALRRGDPSAYPISKAVTFVLEAALGIVRHAAGTPAVSAAAAAPMPPPLPPSGLSRGSDDNGCGGSVVGLSVSELISVQPQLRTTSESGSILSSSINSSGGGSTAGGYASNRGPPSPLLSKGYDRAASADGSIPAGSWSWDWGIQPLVPGVSFPDCLPQKVRAVYDAVNRVVDVARAAMEQLPRVQREVLGLVEESEVVFRKNEAQLLIMSHDMMSAGRLRAALDRNANTISVSPTLVEQVKAAVKVRVTDELRRGAKQMREMVAHGEPDVDVDADSTRECCDSSPRGSGSRSIMARQLNKAADVAAAAVEKEGAVPPDVAPEMEPVLASEPPSNDVCGGIAGDGRDLAGDSADVEYNSSGGGGVNNGSNGRKVSGNGTAMPANGRVAEDAGTQRESASGATAVAGVGAGVAQGGLKPVTSRGKSKGHPPAVSRRVMLPPLSNGT